jgi:hypothetical protein
MRCGSVQVQQTDDVRQFVISYFMNDDTISVFEPPIRNSGILGGKFLERGIKYKPGTEEAYTYKDLYVGAEVVINDFVFALTNADEYTLSYMENNKHLFIMGDGGAVLKLLKAQVAVRPVPLPCSQHSFCGCRVKCSRQLCAVQNTLDRTERPSPEYVGSSTEQAQHAAGKQKRRCALWWPP